MFIIGQRWVSNSEAELGLGLIKETTGRRLEVFFPAVGESRFYASDNAPLSRVIYSVGDEIKTQDGTVFTVSAVQPFNDCYIYQGETNNAEPVSIHEMDLDSQVHFNQPQDRLLAGQVDKNNQFELRAKALAHQHVLMSSPVFGLQGARVQLLPHQLYIAKQVSERYAPRVLLADEVGLGKTIEAGLILHQQWLSGRCRRALIIVPDALLHQWLVEMLRRFNLTFTLIDKDRFDALTEQDEGNPFESAQLMLCGLNELIDHPEMQAPLLAADWDTLIVDEAHHLQWQPAQSSEAYRLVEALAKQIASVILLTATPEQLGVDSHFARLRLLDPDKFHDLETFKQQEAAYQPISELIELLESPEGIKAVQQTEIQQQLSTFIADNWLQPLLDEAQFEAFKPLVVRQLLDRHGTGRVLFRNTREVVSGFPARQLHTYPLPAPVTLLHAGAEAILPETILGEDWLQQDARVGWLVELLKQHRAEKILVICAQAETAQTLETYLTVSHGIRSTVFHEGLSLVNRDRAAAYFADDEDGAQVMICSEIGSEGRNFQFCHHLVLFDLPTNPDLLEQRIGRLDRIGQQQDVNIHVPYYEQTAQAVLMHWYRDGLQAFERVFPAGQAVYVNTQQALQHCLANPADANALAMLISDTQQIANETLAALHSGRHRLLERNSFDVNVANDIVADVEEATRALELADFMDDVFDAYGVDQQPHSSDSIILEPGNQMPFDFPALPEDGLTATFQRHRALAREDMAFLNWEHPMVLGALDLVLNNELGNSAFCTLPVKGLPAGTLLIEAIMVVKSIGGQQTQTLRYLPQNALRLVMSETGRQYQEQLTTEKMNKLVGRIPKATAQQLIRHGRDKINQLVEQVQAASKQPETVLKEQAMAAMSTELDAELERLQALAKVNTTIRQQELDYLVDHKNRLAERIQSAKLVIDAIRIAIVTEPN